MLVVPLLPVSPSLILLHVAKRITFGTGLERTMQCSKFQDLKTAANKAVFAI